MTDLDLADDSVAGIVAFWSVIHVPDHAIPGVFEQFRRVLRPRVCCWSAFTSVTRPDTRPRATRVARSTSTVTIVGRARSTGWLRDAGFTIEAELVIGPDEDVPGAVIFARSDV